MTAQDMFPIAGGCHCGNVRFVLHWPGKDREIPARRCSCTFCSKHHGRWTSHPSAVLEVDLTDADAVSRYRFGTGTADFCVCAICGIVPLVISTIDGTDYAVVNVNTFDELDNLSLSESPTNFDGEDTSSRLGRRERNWISRVSFD